MASVFSRYLINGMPTADSTKRIDASYAILEYNPLLDSSNMTMDGKRYSIKLLMRHVIWLTNIMILMVRLD
jgi:hypothetical protein